MKCSSREYQLIAYNVNQLFIDQPPSKNSRNQQRFTDLFVNIPSNQNTEWPLNGLQRIPN